MGLTFTNRTIDKYFSFLRHLDNSSKKRLIIKLTESIEDRKEPKVNLRDLSGAWEDSRDSDEIIKEIRDSRVEKHDNIEFE
jgi:hypothetical protein